MRHCKHIHHQYDILYCAGAVISWRSDIATAEDLAGVSAMDTGGDWTKEPDSPNSGDQQQSPRSNWADFNAAFGSKE